MDAGMQDKLSHLSLRLIKVNGAAVRQNIGLFLFSHEKKARPGTTYDGGYSWYHRVPVILAEGEL